MDSEEQDEPNKPSFVYLLESTNKSTYVGATVDLTKRLRQHNKEIKGGAVATSIKVQKGEQWTRICHVAGFPSWNAALQFEWRWKQLSRKLPANMRPLERRIKALQQLLALDRPTSKAIPYSEWPNKPEVIIEDQEYYNIVNNKLC
jgi:predicted GIY-YIG superfamily endonuclease